MAHQVGRRPQTLQKKGLLALGTAGRDEKAWLYMPAPLSPQTVLERSGPHLGAHGRWAGCYRPVLTPPAGVLGSVSLLHRPGASQQ